MNKDKTLIDIIQDLIVRQIQRFLPQAISIDFVEIKEVNEADLNAKVQSLESQGEYFVDLVIDKEKKTAWIKPKVGSTAYVTSNNGVKFFCLFNQIENIVIGEGSTEQGVIKIKEQTEKLNELKSTVNDLITKFNNLLANYKTHNHTHPQGTTTGFVAPYTGGNQSNASDFNKSDYELQDIILTKY